MQVFFTVYIALLFTQTVNAGTITDTALILSSNVPSATGVTVGYNGIHPGIITDAGKIVITIYPQHVAWNAPAVPVCTFTAPSPLANTAAYDSVSGKLNVTLNAGVTAAAGIVSFSCTGATNRATFTYGVDMKVETQTSAGVQIDYSSGCTFPGILYPLTSPVATLSSNIPNATNVTVSFSTNTTNWKIQRTGKIVWTLSGFAWPATPVCTFTSPAAAVNTATFACGELSVLLPFGQPAAGLVAFSCTGATNPASQAALTNVLVKTQDRASNDECASDAGTLPKILGVITGAAVTLSSYVPSATGVTVSYTGSNAGIITAAGKIVITLTGFAWPAAPVCTFTAPSTLANTAAFATNTLTVTLNANVTAAAGTVTFSCTGATNPVASQAALTTVSVKTQDSAAADIDFSVTGKLAAITAAVSASNSVNQGLSYIATAGAAVAVLML